MFITISILCILSFLSFLLLFLAKRISKVILTIKSLKERKRNTLELIRKVFLFNYYKGPKTNISGISNDEIQKLPDSKEIVKSVFGLNPLIYIFIFIFSRNKSARFFVHFNLANIFFSLIINYLASFYLCGVNILEVFKIIIISILSFFF